MKQYSMSITHNTEQAVTQIVNSCENSEKASNSSFEFGSG